MQDFAFLFVKLDELTGGTFLQFEVPLVYEPRLQVL